MKSFKMSNLKVEGTEVSVDIDGHGHVTVDFSQIPDFFVDYPNLKKPTDFAKAALKDGALWFPPDIHVEPEYLIEAAESQKALPIGASFKDRVDQKYRR